MPAVRAHDAARFPRTHAVLGALLLAILVALPYAQLRHHEFVHFDDYGYIVDNPHVNGGLTRAGLRWAFTTTHMANWHPLTWISHMLDCQWFGLDPGAHHLTGAALHLVNAVLLFFALRLMTRQTAPSLVVAALFAVHPLRVESVAWASERKDLLAGLFWMLAMLAWVAYARRPGISRYLAVCACMAAGLLAKPMLVTLPVALLLIDYWPLRRLWGEGASPEGPGLFPPVPPRRAVGEKLPLLALAVVSTVATVVAQSAGGAVQDLAGLSLAARIGNAATSYVAYLWKTVWPARLAFYYPHPAIVAPDGAASLLLPALAAAAVLALVTALAVRFARTAPQIIVGWLWYVATLLPVIGVVQVGNQAMADRYTYIPLIGIYLAVVWSLRALAVHRPVLRAALVAAAAVAVVALTVTTSLQARSWRDSRTLFEHALKVTDDNYVAHVNLGNVFVRAGELDAAETEYREALRIAPDQVEAHHNLAGVFLQRGDIPAAISHYRAAIGLRPEYVSAHLNLGRALDTAGALRQAVVHYERAARIDPRSFRAHELLAGAMARLGDDEAAARHYRRALTLRPDSLRTAYSLAWLLATSPDPEVRDGSEALALATRCAEASGFEDPYVLACLAAASAENGRFDDAVRWQARALELAPAPSRERFAAHLQLYRNGSPLREVPGDRPVETETP
jgi:tetratricopeptide (TPR) repeat protein